MNTTVILIVVAVILVILYSARRSSRLRRTGEELDGMNRVVVTDVQMPFWSMVTFMIKWAIAAIPAIIILMFIGVFVVGIFGGLGALLPK
jgi:hypothetical protein